MTEVCREFGVNENDVRKALSKTDDPLTIAYHLVVDNKHFVDKEAKMQLESFYVRYPLLSNKVGESSKQSNQQAIIKRKLSEQSDDSDETKRQRIQPMKMIHLAWEILKTKDKKISVLNLFTMLMK